MISEFIFAHLGTILGVLGGLGGVAAVAFVVIAGIPVAAVLASAISAFGKMVDFLKTPVGQGVAVVLLIALALFIGDAHGRRVEMKLSAGKVAARDVYWKAQIKKAADDFATARHDRDGSVATEIDKLVNNRLLEIKAQEQAITLLGAQNAKHPSADPCVLTPADLGVREPAKRTAGAAAGRRPARQ